MESESQIRIALPKGRLLGETSRLVSAAGWDLGDYTDGARLYHLASGSLPGLTAKIFQEKDIPIQVAIGNYDLGICGEEWIREQTSKYPGSDIVRIRDLGYGSTFLRLCTSRYSYRQSIPSLCESPEAISIASEYPNTAESLALSYRLKRFVIFPVWGAAEAYPPDGADLALIASHDESLPPDLLELDSLPAATAHLIANRISWETKDLSRVLAPFLSNIKPVEKIARPYSVPSEGTCQSPDSDSLRLALPDGHAQKHVVRILEKAGIEAREYSSGNRRPATSLAGVTVKVIRPQDMPLQVANGKFDLAITGLDWVKEHLYKFPSSPIVALLDLKYSRVKIVAAIPNEIEENDIAGVREYANAKGIKLRVASEYVSIADKYARDHHLGQYRVIPTWGATESFLPDDADILIENTETGTTLKRHNLKIIETLFESSACLLANRNAMQSAKAAHIEQIAGRLRQAVEEI